MSPSKEVIMPNFLERIQPLKPKQTESVKIPVTNIFDRTRCLFFIISDAATNASEYSPEINDHPSAQIKNIKAEMTAKTKVKSMILRLSFMDRIAPRKVNANPPRIAETKPNCAIIY